MVMPLQDILDSVQSFSSDINTSRITPTKLNKGRPCSPDSASKMSTSANDMSSFRASIRQTNERHDSLRTNLNNLARRVKQHLEDINIGSVRKELRDLKTCLEKVQHDARFDEFAHHFNALEERTFQLEKMANTSTVNEALEAMDSSINDFHQQLVRRLDKLEGINKEKQAFIAALATRVRLLEDDTSTTAELSAALKWPETGAQKRKQEVRESSFSSQARRFATPDVAAVLMERLEHGDILEAPTINKLRHLFSSTTHTYHRLPDMPTSTFPSSIEPAEHSEARSEPPRKKACGTPRQPQTATRTKSSEAIYSDDEPTPATVVGTKQQSTEATRRRSRMIDQVSDDADYGVTAEQHALFSDEPTPAATDETWQASTANMVRGHARRIGQISDAADYGLTIEQLSLFSDEPIIPPEPSRRTARVAKPAQRGAEFMDWKEADKRMADASE